MKLKDNFLQLKQKVDKYSLNPLFNCFNQDDLEKIDDLASSDSFIADKKKNIQKLIKNHDICFDPKLKSAFDEYSEAMAYLRLKNKFDNVERIREVKNKKTPDFKIVVKDNTNRLNKEFTVYAELKSMSFASGNLNYKNSIEQGLEAQNDIESQLKKGAKCAIGITNIQPMANANKKYDPFSTKYAIETLIEKITHNFKKGQYAMGDTVLLIDLKQLTLPSYYIEGGIPVFQEGMYNSNVSGVQWNTAFGKSGHLVFKPIEFEGKENIDGELERDGILINQDLIKAIIFFDYALHAKEPKVVGLYKQHNITEGVELFINQFCDFFNDDFNSYGYKYKLTKN